VVHYRSDAADVVKFSQKRKGWIKHLNSRVRDVASF